MKTQTAKYTSPGNATLTVYAKQGRQAITVAVRFRTPDGKTQTGCKDTFALDQEADALAMWERRKAEAVKVGWVEKVKTPRSQAFVTLPPPPGLAAPTKKGKAA